MKTGAGHKPGSVPMPESTCPGCGLHMPASRTAYYDGYYNTSPECWSVYTEVLGAEFSNALLYGQVHQMTVDTYAVQHAGGPHPDKSIAVHLSGLYLVFERGCHPPYVAPLLQRMASQVREWPHFTPPSRRGTLTVFDVALNDSVQGHIDTVRDWAGQLWQAWSDAHPGIARLVAGYLDLPVL